MISPRINVKTNLGIPTAARATQRAVKPMVNILQKGLIVSSDDIVAERLPDGRMKLRLR